MSTSKSELKAVDFFCGGGGMTCGFKRAGINVIAGIDIDSDCEKTYSKNHPGAEFINSDINFLEPSDLRQRLKLQRNDPDLIFIGCSPCQYWSIINTNKSKSEKSKNLILRFQEFIDYFKPGFIVIENVPGILSKEDSPLEQFIEFIENKGYHATYSLVNVTDFGVPQTRKRFLLIASRISKIEIYKPKSPKNIKVRDFIGVHNGFRKIKPGNKYQDDQLHYCAGLSDINIKRLKSTPKDGGTRLSWKDDEELQLNTYRGRDDSFKDVYGRMFWDKPAPTITTKFFSISNGRFGHPSENRAISLREGATLQTFPKSYKFLTSSIASTAKLIGNAVPPKLGYYIGKSILRSL